MQNLEREILIQVIVLGFRINLINYVKTAFNLKN